MKKTITLLLVLMSFLRCSVQTGKENSRIIEGRNIIADSGMVVSAHPESSRIGLSVLRKGGNAIDAAVATEFALSVCYPEAGNIGGGGFMLIRTSDGKTDVIDYREKAPALATRDMYLDKAGNVSEKCEYRYSSFKRSPGYCGWHDKSPFKIWETSVQRCDSTRN